MEIIKELKPAEVYFLMHWFASDTNLLNYTLGSLLMDKSLEIKYIKKLPHARAKRLTTYKMVSRGLNFNHSNTRCYEKKLLEVMGQNQKKEIQLRLFTKAIGSKFMKGSDTFRDDCFGRSKVLNGYFEDRPILKYMDRRTTKGKKLGKQLKTFIEAKDKELKSYQNSDNTEKILELISELGVHVILLKNFSNEVMKALKTKYARRSNESFADFVFLDNEYSNFSDFSDSFDSFGGFGGGDFGGSGAGGDWGDADSGCSSCSGCSGCGGCGGCS